MKTKYIFLTFLATIYSGINLSYGSLSEKDDRNYKFLKTSTLNFEFKTTDNYMINSGFDGNIDLWEPCFVDLDNRAKAKKFDVDEMHKQLFAQEQQLTKDWNRDNTTNNVVTAAITILIHNKNQYYAYNLYLGEDIGKKTEETPKRMYGFVSGTEGRNLPISYVDATTYSLSKLYKDSLQRVVSDRFTQNDELKEILKNIQTIQIDKVSIASKQLENCNDVLEMQERLKDFDKNLTSEQRKNCQRSAGYGPIADSEQFLLYHLKEELIKESEQFEKIVDVGLYVTAMTSYIDKQYRYINDSCIINYRNQELAQQQFTKGLSLIGNINDYKIIGNILHLFTTREPCNFCAVSLVEETFFRENNFVTKIKNYSKSTTDNSLPFFVTMVSYKENVSLVSCRKSEDEGAINQNTHPLRPKGIVSGNMCEPLNYKDKISLNLLIEQNCLPITELTDIPILDKDIVGKTKKQKKKVKDLANLN